VNPPGTGTITVLAELVPSAGLKNSVNICGETSKSLAAGCGTELLKLSAEDETVEFPADDVSDGFEIATVFVGAEAGAGAAISVMFVGLNFSTSD
jgi:hypothetical protein